MPISERVLCQLEAERNRQIDKGYTLEKDDEMKNHLTWCSDIEAYCIWARQMGRMGALPKYRHRMMQIAALAIAACESFDRVCTPSDLDYMGENNE